ncbi:MBOAT family O-acyltransferase [Oceanisphaera sp. W20_SRM_FM3]|uniref:MBOAT family O-acyltransferase n=1 Tax=Oceanisphaera sp. W20_SRM_FM3 TaxID=3240267 RepID=UPI003F9CB316
MNFLSFEFVAVFVTFLLIYWLPLKVPHLRNGMLIVASYALVALFNMQFAVILFGFSLFIYGLANHGDRFLHPRQIYILLASCIVSLFVVFKYYAFFRETIQVTLATAGLHLDLPTLNLLLPVGLSYYSFHSVSYVVSVQRKELPKARFDELILYLCFFPSIIAGPINRASHFMPQIQDSQRSLLEPQRAILLIVLAILKLFLFSAWLSEHMVDPVFSDPSGHSAGQNLLAAYAYAWNIYFNFSGYTDLVTGIALLLGFRLPINFNAPYLASNLKEFWARWHISLSTFIRDYVYIPLGGSRKPWARVQINVLIAMVISGLWHGAATTFVVWGALHGLGIVALNIKQQLLPERLWPKQLWPKKLSHLPGMAFFSRNLARVICFHFVCFAWIFFRSDSLDNAMLMLQQISSLQFAALLEHYSLQLLALVLLFVSYPLLVAFTERLKMEIQRVSWWYYPIVLAAVLSLAFSLSPDGMPNFIYASF